MKRSCENNFDSFIPVDPLAPKKMRNKKIQDNYCTNPVNSPQLVMCDTPSEFHWGSNMVRDSCSIISIYDNMYYYLW